VAAALAAIVCVGSGATAAQSESKHFVLSHEAERFGYVSLVLESFEAAYDLFVTRSGFETFPVPVDVRIPSGFMDGMGAEYLDTDAEGNPIPVVEIASEASMSASADESVVGMTLEEAVRSTAAHEFFHVLQDYAALNGKGDIAEPAFIEPHATAIQELAAPEADDYLDAAVDLFFAPDAMPFFDRGYDAGVFWVFVLDRYGLDALSDVMAASAVEDGAAAVDRAFAARGMSALDLWAKFVAAWAADALPDRDARGRMLAAWRRMLGQPALWLPAPIATGAWDGTPLVLDRVTEETSANDVLGYSDSALGASLRVSSSYGIDIVSILPQSDATLEISVGASEAASFRIAISGRRGAVWDLLSVSGRTAIVSAPARYDEIRVWVTRGEVGSGHYTVTLSGSG